MTSMSKDELTTFLTQGTFTAKLATVNKDGSLHIVPVWFAIDSEGLKRQECMRKGIALKER